MSFAAAHFHNEEAAYAFVEARLWPQGPVCPHCGGVERISKMQGESTRVGTYKCYQCRKPFTVKIGTIFESSHVAMHLWLQAMYLIAGRKKGISSNQLHRILGVTLKTAWFMSHRIREAMRAGELDIPFGSGGTAVEVDETYIGVLKGQPIRQSGAHKMKVLSLVDRATGRVRSYTFDQMISTYFEPICRENIAKEARLITDGARLYKYIGKQFGSHESVDHSRGEYARGDVFTNTVEGSFSIFKRGMKGVYQYCSEHHLHRYLAEFDFRYSNRAKLGVTDTERADLMLVGAVGKRLTYQRARIGG